MKKIFEVNEVCPSCKGTGLYIGMGERDGAAVVCHTCKGTGCHAFKHEYEEFTEWKTSMKFKPGAENRICTCPSQWYQSADYSKKPDWEECIMCGGGGFSGCYHFSQKQKCLRRLTQS